MPKPCPHEPLSTTEDRDVNLCPHWNAIWSCILPYYKQSREIFVIFPLPFNVQELILLFRIVLDTQTHTKDNNIVVILTGIS